LTAETATAIASRSVRVNGESPNMIRSVEPDVCRERVGVERVGGEDVRRFARALRRLHPCDSLVFIAARKP
jgi:hypothetical protein